MRKTEKAKPEAGPAPGENPPTGAGAGGEGVGGGCEEPWPAMMAIAALVGVISRPATTALTTPPGVIANEAESAVAAEPIVLRTVPACCCPTLGSSGEAGTDVTEDAAGIEIARETPPGGGVPAVEAGPLDRPRVAGVDAEPVSTDPLPPLPLGW